MATRNHMYGLAATVLAGLATLATAQIVQECPTSGICYSLSIPETSASSGSGDIYFQVQAPTTYQWVALGQGRGMAGSNIFVVYTDSTGQNVTVSPRIGTGNVQPQHSTAAQIELLEGSGVSNGVMTANVRCSNCDSWEGGSMDFSASSASWIHAWLSGDALDSDALDENIRQHSDASSFTWDLSSARNSQNVNPFVAATGTTSGDGSTASDGQSIPATCTPISDSAASDSTASSATASDGASSTSSTSSSSDSDSTSDNDEEAGSSNRPPWANDNDGDNRPPWAQQSSTAKLRRRQSSSSSSSSSCPAGYAPISATNTSSSTTVSSTSNTVILAHAVLASLAFVALFPFGGILIRLASFPHLTWIHAGIQAFGYLLYIVAFGLGVYMARSEHYWGDAHPIIGTLLFVILLVQPVAGWLHHRLWKKYWHRTLWSYVHLSIGRIAILLGIINGGLGLRLAQAGGGSKIAYGVVAAVVGLTYIVAIVVGERKRKRNAAAAAAGAPRGKESGSPPRYSNSETEMEHYGSGSGRA